MSHVRGCDRAWWSVQLLCAVVSNSYLGVWVYIRSSDTPVRQRPSVLTPAANPAACGYVLHGRWANLDADMPALIGRSARLVDLVLLMEPFVLILPVLVQAASSTSSAESTVAARERPSRGFVVESLVAPPSCSLRAVLSLPSLHRRCNKHHLARGFFGARSQQLLLTAFTEISCSSFHLVDGVGRLRVRSDCPTNQPLDNGLRVVSQAGHRVQRAFPSGRTIPAEIITVTNRK